MTTKPAIYPNVTLRNAAASFPPPARQMNLSLPRTVADTWGCDLRKWTSILNAAFCHQPSAVGGLLAVVAECADMAKAERIYYPKAGWRE